MYIKHNYKLNNLVYYSKLICFNESVNTVKNNDSSWRYVHTSGKLLLSKNAKVKKVDKIRHLYYSSSMTITDTWRQLLTPMDKPVCFV